MKFRLVILGGPVGREGLSVVDDHRPLFGAVSVHKEKLALAAPRGSEQDDPAVRRPAGVLVVARSPREAALHTRQRFDGINVKPVSAFSLDEHQALAVPRPGRRVTM